MKKIAMILVVLLLLSMSWTSVDAAPSRIIHQGPSSPKVIALTFDDGADGTNIDAILEVLKAHNIKTTFFLTGAGVNHHPSKIRRIVSQGHEIANHSYSHPDFRNLTFAQMDSELKRTETAIKNVTGIYPKKLFRAPYGAYNSHVLDGVGRAGYPYTIQWNIDTIDWRGDSATTIYNRVINNAKAGSIVLMHTGKGATGTVAALPKMINELKRQGYGFVTVSRLLNPTSGTTPPANFYYYTVKSGDTLYRISLSVGVPMAEIVKLNKIADPNRIYVGQRLMIPTKEPGTPPPSTSYYYYTVKSGDTLYRIALNAGVPMAEIVRLNNIADPNRIYVGQRLKIPSKTSTPAPPPAEYITYTVRSGDTLYRIALNYGVSVTEIVRINNIADPNRIYVGQQLKIPRK
jgi:peptidoglycan-N-acetylglucosamine deacetylase